MGYLVNNCDFGFSLKLNKYGGEDTEEIIEQLLACEAYCNAKGDPFNAGFFHTLVELLSVRYNLTLFEGEVIDRELFKMNGQEYVRSWGFRKQR